MADVTNDTLSDAVSRNCAAVLSLPSAGMFRNFKSRLLAKDSTGIWMEAILSERPLIEELISTKQPVGVSFKSGTLRVVFASPALALNPEYQISPTVQVPAMLIVNPALVKQIQRRTHYRVRAYDGCGLSVRIWPIALGAYLGERPMSAQELNVHLRDISIGGMGVTLSGKDGQPPRVTMEDRLRIELRYGAEVLVLEGRMRPPFGPQPVNGIGTGVQFKEMEKDLEGRRKLTLLTKITGEMQREEMRRSKMGIA